MDRRPYQEVGNNTNAGGSGERRVDLLRNPESFQHSGRASFLGRMGEAILRTTRDMAIKTEISDQFDKVWEGADKRVDNSRKNYKSVGELLSRTIQETRTIKSYVEDYELRYRRHATLADAQLKTLEKAYTTMPQEFAKLQSYVSQITTDTEYIQRTFGHRVYAPDGNINPNSAIDIELYNGRVSYLQSASNDLFMKLYNTSTLVERAKADIGDLYQRTGLTIDEGIAARENAASNPNQGPSRR